MKAKKIDPIERESGKPFPKLVQSNGNADLVVLGTRATIDGKFIGVVVNVGVGSQYKVGTINELFARECFEDFHGTIELSNY